MHEPFIDFCYYIWYRAKHTLQWLFLSGCLIGAGEYSPVIKKEEENEVEE